MPQQPGKHVRPHVLALRVGLSLLLMAAGTGLRAQGIGVTVNGQPVTFQDIGPQQIDGRTLVPVRGVLEKLGANVAYLPQTQTVVASTPKIDVQLKIGSKMAVVNGNNVTLDVPAQVIHDHTFVPLRFLGESLGADVSWDPGARTVRILTKDALNASVTPPARPVPSTPRPAPTAPHPTTASNRTAAIIDFLTQDASGWLRSGTTLRVALDGTPGGQAMFRIPGIVENVPLREASRGHYVGTWQVPAGQSLQTRLATIVGRLKVGDKPAVQKQADRALSIDSQPPAILDRTPEEAVRVSDPRPTISAVLADEGSGVDPKSVRLLFDGRDVTAETRVTPDGVTYRPSSPLPPGPHTTELRVRDVAGNATSSRWTFSEQTGEQTVIQSVRHDATRPLLVGDILFVELNGVPGCRVAFSAGNIQNVPLREEHPGHYVCRYVVRRGDIVAGRPIQFHLQTPDGRRFQQASREVVRINADRPR